MRRWAGLGLVALAAAACVAGPGARSIGPGSAAISPSPPPSLAAATFATPLASPIAWSGTTPAPSAAPTASRWPTGPACRVDQLVATAWLDEGGATLGGYTVWNDAATPCSIGRAVAVAILDAAGHALPVSPTVVPLGPMCGGTGGQCPPPGPTPPPWIFMPPSAPDAQNGGDSAHLAWTNWCGPQPYEPLTLRITLGDVTIARTSGLTVPAPRCANASGPSRLAVTPIEIGGEWPTPPPAIPADALKAQVKVAGGATVGQPLAYVVVLTNLTGSPISLSPCPSYQERINARGGPVVEEHVLNCGAVGSIAPGQSVPFAMRIDVPASLPASTDAALVWILDPNYSQGFPPPLGAPGAKVGISVVAP